MLGNHKLAEKEVSKETEQEEHKSNNSEQQVDEVNEG
jgi:hypothetical protein